MKLRYIGKAKLSIKNYMDVKYNDIIDNEYLIDKLKHRPDFEIVVENKKTTSNKSRKRKIRKEK